MSVTVRSSSTSIACIGAPARWNDNHACAVCGEPATAYHVRALAGGRVVSTWSCSSHRARAQREAVDGPCPTCRPGGVQVVTDPSFSNVPGALPRCVVCGREIS